MIRTLLRMVIRMVDARKMAQARNAPHAAAGSCRCSPRISGPAHSGWLTLPPRRPRDPIGSAPAGAGQAVALTPVSDCGILGVPGFAHYLASVLVAARATGRSPSRNWLVWEPSSLFTSSLQIVSSSEVAASLCRVRRRRDGVPGLPGVPFVTVSHQDLRKAPAHRLAAFSCRSPGAHPLFQSNHMAARRPNSDEPVHQFGGLARADRGDRTLAAACRVLANCALHRAAREESWLPRIV